jgi:hypothetical protein
MDYTTGQILTAGNEHQQRNPASLTKLMTGYVVDRAIDSHHITGRYGHGGTRPGLLATQYLTVHR